MKFVPVRDLRLRPGQVWKHLSKEEVIVTSKGQPIALLTKVTAETFEREVAQLRKARALAALDDIQREAARTGRDLLTEVDIEREIHAVRKARRR
jgi:antitoxin (DNA-binding transcriptional repressor) of toxin-antitoxin stability system